MTDHDRDCLRPEIQERTFAFAVRILKLVNALKNDIVGQTIARQIARSGTSLGANVEEAQGAHSRADFTHRMNIARAEARDTLYWLRLIAAVGILRENRMKNVIEEANAIVRILVSIVKTARSNREQEKRPESRGPFATLNSQL